MEKSGFILIDKPAGITSHDVVDRLRRITGIRKIGHAGTLDPFATGLLVIGIGREATKRLGEMMGKDKEYAAVAVLGATSDTQDLTGEVIPTPNAVLPKKETVEQAISEFIGEIEQIPPMYSAKKIKGQKLYELARKGETIERKPNRITIHSLTIDDFTMSPPGSDLRSARAQRSRSSLRPIQSETSQKNLSPKLSFTVRCSPGTYIRTLANDIGQKLGCGAYLEELRRTKSGEFDISQAVRLEELTKDNWAGFLR